MDFSLLTENIANYRKALMALGCLCAALVLVIILLTALCFSLKNDRTTVLVPLGLGDKAWVSDGALSASYLRAVAQNVISLRYNVTPESVEARDKLLLAITAPAVRPELASVLSQEAKMVEEDQVSSVFFLESLKTSIGKTLSVEATGKLVTYSGLKPVSKEFKHIELTFNFNGVLLLSGLKEVKNHA